MRVDKKRKGQGIREVLQVVSSALAWGASEIHIMPDKFYLELKAEPVTDKTKTLEELLHLRNVGAIRLTGDVLRDLQGVFTMCVERKYFLTRMFVRDTTSLFEWAKLTKASTLMGVPVLASELVPEGGILFALSRVPHGPISTTDILLKGEYHED